MIIERFFGKGRTGQPETPPPQTSAPAQGQKKSPAPNADEPKPRRTAPPAAAAEATARPSQPTKRPASKVVPGGPAVAEPAGSGVKPGALTPPSYEEIAARAVRSLGSARAARRARSRELD